MPSAISDLEQFAPKGDFLKELIDTSADAVMNKATGQTVTEAEKPEQRRVFIDMTSRLACLKGKGIVNTILGELDVVATNRDFLDAMKRIEPLLRRVRDRLAQLQILIPDRDPLSTLQFRQPVTQKPVSVLQKLTRTEQIKESELAVEFINNIFPQLARKLDEVQRGAYEVESGVHRDDYDFSGVSYGKAVVPISNETNVDSRLWNGVRLPNRSEYGMKLLRLSLDPQHQGRVISFAELCTLVSDDPQTPVTEGALKQGLNKIDHLFKDAEKLLPYEKVHGQGIRFVLGTPSLSSSQVLNPEVTDFIPNADFLEQLITLSSKKEATSPEIQELTAKDIDSLGLSSNAAKILTYMMEDAGDRILNVADVVRDLSLGAHVAAGMAGIRDEINGVLKGRTQKRITVAGTKIGFGIIE